MNIQNIIQEEIDKVVIKELSPPDLKICLLNILAENIYQRLQEEKYLYPEDE